MAIGWDMGAIWCLSSAPHSLWVLSVEVSLTAMAVIVKQEQQKLKKKAPNKQTLQLCPTYSLVLSEEVLP